MSYWWMQDGPLTWIDGLLYQLCEQRMLFRLWLILRCYYIGFESSVQIDSELSEWFHVHQGVHQGGICSMHLYKLFVNSLLEEVTARKKGCSISSLNCVCPLWADDVALIVLYPEVGQELLDIADKHRCRWRYEYNVPKCVAQIYSSRQNVDKPPLF